MFSTHSYQDGSFGIGHTGTEKCACKPSVEVIRKRSSSGKGGSHQGYRIEKIVYRHNPLPVNN